jgi:hypothetical protein
MWYSDCHSEKPRPAGDIRAGRLLLGAGAGARKRIFY